MIRRRLSDQVSSPASCTRRRPRLHVTVAAETPNQGQEHFSIEIPAVSAGAVSRQAAALRRLQAMTSARARRTGRASGAEREAARTASTLAGWISGSLSRAGQEGGVSSFVRSAFIFAALLVAGCRLRQRRAGKWRRPAGIVAQYSSQRPRARPTLLSGRLHSPDRNHLLMSRYRPRTPAILADYRRAPRGYAQSQYDFKMRRPEAFRRISEVAASAIAEIYLLF